MSFIDRLMAGARRAVNAITTPDAKQDARLPEHMARVAPWPLVDRYPTVLGANLSFQSIANVMRTAQTGYRQPMVDLLAEQLEREPHGFAVLSQRILAVAGGRLELVPAETREDDPEKERAEEIADTVNAIVRSIPDLKQSLATLLWALYYGVSASEISWGNDGGMWKPTRLHMVHSRRIAYPDQSSWDVHIWDQGNVRGWGDMLSAPTNGIYGLRVEDYPGKFIVHAPRLRGEYPTREGLGRELSYWFAIKALASRGAAQYIERFSKPWVLAYWSTSDTGQPRAADDDDIAKAVEATKALGIGSLSSATLPNSVAIELKGPGQGTAKAALTYEQLISICNAEISKAVQGQTFTTEPGKFGSKGTANAGKASTMQIAEYDAGCLAETLDRDLIYWIVKLNWPDELHLAPKVRILVEDEPDATEMIERGAKGASAGMPVDADALAHRVGLPLIPREEGDTRPRRMAPVKPVGLGELDGIGDSPADALDEASRAQAVSIPSATFKKLHKTKVAHALLPDADELTKKRIEKEIGDGVESEAEMQDLLAEASRQPTQEDPDEEDEEEDVEAAE